MRQSQWTCALIVGLLLGQTSLVTAGSIWAKKGVVTENMYSDDVASKIGDILTINISEVSSATNEVKSNLSKDTSRSTSFNGDLGITTDNHDLIPRMPGMSMSSDSSNSLTGNSKYEDGRTFVDTITVVVQDVQPNGNLVVMGKRERNIAGDIQILEVTGIVRPSDIAFNNTIASGQVANFYLSTTIKGISKTYNKQGWLGSLFDILWPF